MNSTLSVEIYNAGTGNGTKFKTDGSYTIPYNYSQFKSIEVFVRMYDLVGSFVLDLEHNLSGSASHAGATFLSYSPSSGNYFHYYALVNMNKEKTVLTPLYCGYYDINFSTRTERHDNNDYLVTKVVGYK